MCNLRVHSFLVHRSMRPEMKSMAGRFDEECRTFAWQRGSPREASTCHPDTTPTK